MSDMIMSFLPPLIDRMMLSNGVSLNDAGTPIFLAMACDRSKSNPAGFLLVAGS
jgi:hypothetical protein